MFIGRNIYRREKIETQNKRSRNANQNLNSEIKVTRSYDVKTKYINTKPENSGTTASRYALFLRPFATDSISIKNNNELNILRGFLPGHHLIRDSKTTFDEHIRRSLPSDFEFLSITSDLTHIGAAAIQTADDNWKNTFRRLANRSSIFILTPGLREGIEWEIMSISKMSLHSKCLFIFIPTDKHDPQEIRNCFLFSGIKIMMAKHGFDIDNQPHLMSTIDVGDAVIFNNHGMVVFHKKAVATGNYSQLTIDNNKSTSCIKALVRPSQEIETTDHFDFSSKSTRLLASVVGGFGGAIWGYIQGFSYIELFTLGILFALIGYFHSTVGRLIFSLTLLLAVTLATIFALFVFYKLI
jgi:hypothetical protein